MSVVQVKKIHPPIIHPSVSAPFPLRSGGGAFSEGVVTLVTPLAYCRADMSLTSLHARRHAHADMGRT